MAFTTAEGRVELLAELGEAADELGVALAALTVAYELLDDATAETLEDELYRPVQRAYGRAKRTHGEFAATHGLPKRGFQDEQGGRPSEGVKALIDRAVDSAANADHLIAELQDSMLPTEVGDPALRASLADIRSLIAELPLRARQIVARLGR